MPRSSQPADSTSPAPRHRVEQSDQPDGQRARGGGRGRGARQKRRQLETAVRERHEIRNERNPLARRHLPASERHIAPDELGAKDWTRPLRVAAVTEEIEGAYERRRAGQ